jgi:hypothetical protein
MLVTARYGERGREMMAWQGTSRRTTGFWPAAPAFLLGLLLLSLVLVGLVQAGVLVYAYQRIADQPGLAGGPAGHLDAWQRRQPAGGAPARRDHPYRPCRRGLLMAAALAYVAVLGTLLGADVLNLRRVR